MTHAEIRKALASITPQALEALKELFPEPRVEPGQNREAALYAAGGAFVVRHIETCIDNPEP